MRPQMEQSLFIEFDELFALRDRLRAVADQVRARLYAAGLQESLQTEVFDHELELRGTGQSRLLIRLDSFRLDISGAPAGMPVPLVAAIILEEAGAFRLTMVECGFHLTTRVGRGRRLNLIQEAFRPMVPEDAGEPMLDRRLHMTWEWGNATTGFSFMVSDTEDRELFLSFKARVGYMDLPELQGGRWVMEQAQRFERLVDRFFAQLGWDR